MSGARLSNACSSFFCFCICLGRSESLYVKSPDVLTWQLKKKFNCAVRMKHVCGTTLAQRQQVCDTWNEKKNITGES